MQLLIPRSLFALFSVLVSVSILIYISFFSRCLPYLRLPQLFHYRPIYGSLFALAVHVFALIIPMTTGGHVYHAHGRLRTIVEGPCLCVMIIESVFPYRSMTDILMALSYIRRRTSNMSVILMGVITWNCIRRRSMSVGGWCLIERCQWRWKTLCSHWFCKCRRRCLGMVRR